MLNIKQTQRSIITYIGIMLLSSSLLCQTTAAAQDQPNIVIMMSDDQGYGDVGFHNNPYLKTPNIKAIAENGLEMDTFISYPNCSASRAALLTGRYPYRTGVTAVTQVDHFMNADEITIAEILQENGYKTGIFGKWHVGDNYPMRPTDQGFQEALVHKGGGIGQAAGPKGNTYFDPVLEHNNISKTYKGYCDDIFTDAALNFIETSKNKPFLLYLATNLPHFPLQVPDKRAQPYRKMGLHEDNALTYGMIDNIDDNVGRVLSKIKDLGIEKNTLVIFLSDNGPRNRRTKNDVYPGRWVANLRGTKTSVYEAGIRVPFVVSWPGVLPTGKKINNMGTMIDILPTVLEAANISVPNNVKLDGKSLLSLWKNGNSESLVGREFITQMHYGPTPFKYMHFAVRTQKYKLVSPHDDPHHILFQPSDDELKKVLANLELYDIESDPSERINLAAQQPEIVEDLLARYENWFDQVTEERDAKGIQRIFLGTSAQPKVNLSRFDWGGPRVLSENALGFWRVTTVAGKYNVALDLNHAADDGIAHLKYQNVHLTQKVKKGQQSVIFKNVSLPAGQGNFHTYLKTARLATGPYFVDVERVNQ